MQLLVYVAFGGPGAEIEAALLLHILNSLRSNDLARFMAIDSQTTLHKSLVDAGLIFVSATEWRELDVMAACDVVLIPSIQPDIPRALLTAMSIGKTVISADVGGRNEVVSESTGVLLSFKNNDQFAAAVAAAVQRLAADRELRVVLGSAARDDISARFDVQALASCVMPALCAASHVKRAPLHVHLTDALASVVMANAAISRAHSLAHLTEQARELETQAISHRASSFTPQVQAESQWADVVWLGMGVKLLTYNIDTSQAGTLTLQCLWRSTRKIGADYIFFLHVLDDEVCS